MDAAKAKDIRKRLIDIEMSQTELAARIGTSTAYLYQILSGRRPGDTYLDAIEAAIKAEEKSKGVVS